MRYKKILNFLNDANDFKFVTRKCSTVNDNSNPNYGVRDQISYNTEVLKSNPLWLEWSFYFSKRWYYCQSSSCNINSI